jgi:ABC-type branched-subunit amino acid transport system ATPase component
MPNNGTGTDDILRLEGVGHNFGGLTVLRSVTFPVPDNGIVGLIGPNGSGKTTLFNTISGFLLPRKGTITYRGEVLGSSSIQERSRRGMLRTFQTPKVFENMTVLENIMVGCCKGTHTTILQDLAHSPHATREQHAIEEIADAALRKFDLTALRDTLSSNLTAGQRRILEIARAVVSTPKLLLLDEPSSGLNPDEIDSLRRRIVQLRSEGMSILLVSHDMELMTVTDLVHVLYFGEIITSGSMDEIKSNPRVREVYLGV